MDLDFPPTWLFPAVSCMHMAQMFLCQLTRGLENGALASIVF